MSEDFREFVEWVLEIDLTEAQEERLHQMLQEEWEENDRETIELVQGSLATYRLVRGTSPDLQKTWREENRKTFIASLRDNGEEFGESLLNAYASEHSPHAQVSGTSGNASGKQATSGASALGLFGQILGGIALAALAYRAEKAQETREEIKRDPEPVKKTVDEIWRDYQSSQKVVQGYMDTVREYTYNAPSYLWKV